MPYMVVFTAVMLLWLNALNASPVRTKLIFSRRRKAFSKRRSTFAVRGIWKALGGRLGRRFAPPAPNTPEEIARTVAPPAVTLGAVPESKPVYGAPEEMLMSGEMVKPLINSLRIRCEPL